MCCVAGITVGVPRILTSNCENNTLLRSGYDIELSLHGEDNANIAESFRRRIGAEEMCALNC